MRQPFHEIGAALFNLLVSRIQQDTTTLPGGVLYQPELQVRQSTGAPR